MENTGFRVQSGPISAALDRFCVAQMARQTRASSAFLPEMWQGPRALRKAKRPPKRGPLPIRPVVRMKGLEPSRELPHSDLNAARLPIPPHPHDLTWCALSSEAAWGRKGEKCNRHRPDPADKTPLSAVLAGQGPSAGHSLRPKEMRCIRPLSDVATPCFPRR